VSSDIDQCFLTLHTAIIVNWSSPKRKDTDMLTDQEMLEGLHQKNPHADQRDVDATRKFMRCFDCENAESFSDAYEKILISMDMMNEAVDEAPTDYEAHRIIRERLAKL
jgi:hypothetical protein